MLYIVVGSLCIVVALWWLRKSKPTVQEGASEAMMIPDTWDEKTIARGFEHYRGQPGLLAHYIENIKQRFITGQDIKTIWKRTAFMQAEIERMQVGKEYASIIRELERLQHIEDAKDEEAQMNLEQIRRERESRAELHEREMNLKRIQLDRQIAEEMKRIRDLDQESRPQKQTSPEDLRQSQREQLMKEIDRLKAEKKKMAAKIEDEDERVKWENMYDDKIEEVREQIKEYL